MDSCFALIGVHQRGIAVGPLRMKMKCKLNDNKIKTILVDFYLHMYININFHGKPLKFITLALDLFVPKYGLYQVKTYRNRSPRQWAPDRKHWLNYMVGFMTDATKNKASFIAYNNNTLLQQNNFMSTKRTLSEHINQQKKNQI